jgi:hypothetical protein
VTNDSYADRRALHSIGSLLPNLREVDFSHARSVGRFALDDFPPPLLEKVTWHGHWRCLYHSGYELRSCGNLREVYMDGSIFFYDGPLFHHLQDRLERVSIKATRFSGTSTETPEPVPQSELIDFVRDAPNLRWFRSDLAPENVAALRAERPGVTFAP